jgi:8-oxo-dGTP pyrophosphatase MutT (NUDIX family)
MKKVFEGKIFEVLNIEHEGKTFEIVRRSPGVRLLIEEKVGDDLFLVMTREKRRDIGFDFRLPGGKVFDSLKEFQQSDENNILKYTEDSAKKEGKEEVGLDKGDFELLEISKAGTSVDWDLYYYLVNSPQISEQDLEGDEVGNITVVRLSPKEIFEKLKNKEIQENRSADVLWRWLAKNDFINMIN